MRLLGRRGQCSTGTLFLGKWGWYGVELCFCREGFGLPSSMAATGLPWETGLNCLGAPVWPD